MTPAPVREMPGRWRTAALGAMTLWLPPLLPLVFGVVDEVNRATYLGVLLALPGLAFCLPFAFLGLGWAAEVSIAMLGSGAMLAGLTWWLRRLPREGARFVQVVLMALIAGWSFLWAMVIDGMGC